MDSCERAEENDMPLTPADVHNKEFTVTRLRPGYDEEEVDTFLEEVESELERLIQENEDLRSKLNEPTRGDAPVAVAQQERAEAEPAAGAPQPDFQTVGQAQAQQPEPQPTSSDIAETGGQPSEADNETMQSASRMLALAQQTADQAVADARREADETLGKAQREAEETVGKAQREAEETLGKARRQAEQIMSEARSRAEALERDAQERHRQSMGTLVQQREELERKVEDLRAFEREYRSRLKAYLEGRLRDLEAGATEEGPAIGSDDGSSGEAASASTPTQEVRNGQPGAAAPGSSPPLAQPETAQGAGGGLRSGLDPPRRD